jgi:hypothetical protein
MREANTRRVTTPLLGFGRQNRELRNHRKLAVVAIAALLALCGVVYAGWRAQPTVLIATLGKTAAEAKARAQKLWSWDMQ